MKPLSRGYFLCIAVISLLFQTCAKYKPAQAAKAIDTKSFYTMDDFVRLEKYDTHVHLNIMDPAFIKQAQADNFRLLTINVAAPYYPSIEDQQNVAVGLVNAYPRRVAYSTTFPVTDWGSPKWKDEAIAYLENSFKQGAVAVKVWKNIGMELRDPDGKYVFIDDPRFDPILDFIEKNNMTLIAHLGDPRDSWLPVDSMVVGSDKHYYSVHPQFHMYLHPNTPSYQQEIDARDNMLKKHPNLIVVGAHLGSLEWSIDELAKRLDQFPNFAVDLAARVVDLEYQSVQNRQKVREFMIKYQDRILYGTDNRADGKTDEVKLNTTVHETRMRDWEFLTSADEMTTTEFGGTFTGLQLPKEVVNKIYHDNAKKWFPKLG
jgi:predicted TIM-barrel fold metal-dependent hydrolase